MTRLIDGKPGFMVHRECVRLRKALAGGYHFKRVAMGSGHGGSRMFPTKTTTPTLLIVWAIFC